MKPLIDSTIRWLSVVGYEGMYLVSETGEVYSEPRTEYVSCGRVGEHYRYRNGKLLSPSKIEGRYSSVILSKDGVKKTCQVHRLVAEAFLERPSGKTEVNHINGNKHNNKVENLEWVTAKENQGHSTYVLKNHLGSKQANSVLDETDVLCIKEAILLGTSDTIIAKQFNVGRSTIHNIRCGKNWSWLTNFKRVKDATTC